MDIKTANLIRGMYLGSNIGGMLMQSGAQVQGGFADFYNNKFAAQNANRNGAFGLTSAALENNYLMDAAASQNKQISNEAASFSASQKAAIAASGFDNSAGEERLIMDTKYKAKEEKRILLQNALSRTFENTKAAKIQAINMQTQAKLNEIAGKSARITGFINAGASALAAGSSLIANYGELNKALPSANPVQPQPAGTNDFPWATWNNYKSFAGNMPKANSMPWRYGNRSWL